MNVTGYHIQHMIQAFLVCKWFTTGYTNTNQRGGTPALGAQYDSLLEEMDEAQSRLGLYTD